LQARTLQQPGYGHTHQHLEKAVALVQLLALQPRSFMFDPKAEMCLDHLNFSLNHFVLDAA
jgi:hypothetical protein